MALRTKPARTSNRFKMQKEAIARAKRELNEAVRAAFREEANEFFAAHPEVLSFSWKQYTSEHNREYNHPFACLGDYCPLTFKEGDKTLKLAYDGEVYEVLSDPDDDFFDGYESELDIPEQEHEMLRKKSWVVSDAVRKLVTSFQDDELEAMFGDPSEITVTPEKFEVKEYWDFE